MTTKPTHKHNDELCDMESVYIREKGIMIWMDFHGVSVPSLSKALGVSIQIVYRWRVGFIKMPELRIEQLWSFLYRYGIEGFDEPL